MSLRWKREMREGGRECVGVGEGGWIDYGTSQQQQHSTQERERRLGAGIDDENTPFIPHYPPPPRTPLPPFPPPTHSLAEEGEARGAVLLQQRGEHAGHRLVLVQVLPVPLVLSLVIGHWFFGVDLGVNSSCHGSLVFGCGVVKCGVRWGGGICPVIGHSLVGRLNACLGGWVG